MKQSTESALKKPQFRIPEIAIKIITVLILLALWEFLSRAGYIKLYTFSRPTRLVVTFWDLITEGFPKDVTIVTHIVATVRRIILGYLLAAATAIPIGIVVGKVEILERSINPIITFARSIAVISLLPLAIAWFGAGELARILLICWGCFWVILTNTIQGVKQINIQFLRAASVLGTEKRQLFFRVFLPATLPKIFAGMKIALGVAFMVIIAVEMIGTVKGLGALIQQARYYYDTHTAIDGMIIIGVFGLLISLTLDWLERLLLPWARGLEEVER